MRLSLESSIGRKATSWAGELVPQSASDKYGVISSCHSGETEVLLKEFPPDDHSSHTEEVNVKMTTPSTFRPCGDFHHSSHNVGCNLFSYLFLKRTTDFLGRGTGSFLLAFLIPVLSIYSSHDRCSKLQNGYASVSVKLDYSLMEFISII